MNQEKINANTLPDAIFACVRGLLQDHEKSGHGPTHIVNVWDLINNAIYEDSNLGEDEKLCLQLAGLLHEVDDRKICPGSIDYANARTILSSYECSKEIVDLTIEMIDLVSCSKNGNNIPEGLPLWKLIPRDADRVEATGRKGLIRACQVTEDRKEALFTHTTARATTLQELYQIASPERFKKYTETGKSDSMVDHLYDKILHLKPQSDNKFFMELFNSGRNVIEEFLLEFGRTGVVELPVM